MAMYMIRKEIQVLLKQKGLFFWLFLMPIIFIVMFSSIFSNAKDTMTISYYDADQSTISKELMKSIDSIQGFDISEKTDATQEELVQRIKDGKATSLLVIPKGFESNIQAGKPANLELYRDATADSVVGPIQTVLQSVSSSFRDVKLQQVLKASGKSDTEITEALSPSVNVSDVKENSSQADAITQYVPGYTVMFVFFILITMIRNFLKDRDSGMLARLRSTTMKGHHYLIGMWVPNILAVLVQCFVLLIFGKIVYNLNLGDLTSIILIVFSLAICATGIGLALSMYAKSENQGTAFTQLITMGGAVIAGLWFPFDMLPSFAQAVGRFTPQYWAHHGFQDVMIRGAHVGDIWMNLVVLLAYGAGGLLIAALSFKRFVKAATN